jgi:cytochrome c peroxidase
MILICEKLLGFNFRTKILGIATVFLFTISSCTKDDETPVDNSLDDLISMLDLEIPLEVDHPIDNPTNASKVELGRFLFYDPIIGGEKDVACATCHHPDFGYSDGRDLPIGVNGSGLGPDRTENTGGLNLNAPIDLVPRNAPTVINAAYNGLTSSNGYDATESPMFWDSRMSGFEDQCQGPPSSRSEMKGDAYIEDVAMDSIIARIAQIPEYVQLFSDCFGTSGITVENCSYAMGAFERSIIATNSPYDQYIKGDNSALTTEQKKGLILFCGKARCTQCHVGPMFSDYHMHVVGIADNPSHPDGTDKGLDDEYKFRTQTLRNISQTGPYSHSGMYLTLKEMVGHMASGNSDNVHIAPNMLDVDFSARNLTDEEIDQIVAFLEALTDDSYDKVIPASVPSGLPVGGNIK